MGMGFSPTWLRQVSPPLLHKTTLTTACTVESWTTVNQGMEALGVVRFRAHCTQKVKVAHLISRHLQSWTAALYNLGSGSWLALAVIPRRKLAAAHSPR